MSSIPIFGTPKDPLSYGGPEVLELLFLCTANLLSLVFMGWAKTHHVMVVVPEQLISMTVGLMAGVLSSLVGYNELTVDVTVNFSGIFFQFFLPCMVFASAYSVKRKAFFRHWVSILVFAVCGTIVSSLFVAVFMHSTLEKGFVSGYAGLGSSNTTVLDSDSHEAIASGKNARMPFVDCLILGALLSAVDTSASFAVVSQRKHERLFSLLFGESVLNSAFAIVLYNGYRVYHEMLNQRQEHDIDANMETGDIRQLVARFLFITFSSALTGIFVALLSAFTLKRLPLSSHPAREQAITFLYAYLSYIGPRQLGLSPVVSLFFCGATMAHYTFHNMSHLSQVASVTWFRTIGHVAETFVFVFIGASSMVVKEQEWRFDLIGILIACCTLARWSEVFLLGILLNTAKWCNLQRKRISHWCCRRLEDFDEQDHPPHYLGIRAMVFMSWSGLRGSVAFALGMHSPIFNKQGEMLTSIIAVVVFSYAVQGCSLRFVAKQLGYFEEEHDPEETEHSLGSNHAIVQHVKARHRSESSMFAYDESSPYLFAVPNISPESKSHSDYGTFAQALKSFDERYVKPIFGGSVREAPSSPITQEHVTSLENESYGEQRSSSRRDFIVY